MQRLTSAKARAEKGVSSAGFTTTVQPAARAAPTFRVIMALGKFHWIRRERRRVRGRAGPKAGGSRHQPASSAWQRCSYTRELRTPGTCWLQGLWRQGLTETKTPSGFKIL